MENLGVDEEKDVLIFDTGTGRNGTIKKIAWNVLEYKNHPQELCGYQDKSKGKFYPIFNSVTKYLIKDRDIPVLLVINYATLMDEKEKK